MACPGPTGGAASRLPGLAGRWSTRRRHIIPPGGEPGYRHSLDKAADALWNRASGWLAPGEGLATCRDFRTYGQAMPQPSRRSDWRLVPAGVWREGAPRNWPSGIPYATGYETNDIAQPCMRGLVVKPSQPNHGGFDWLRRTRQATEDKVVRPGHAFGNVERKDRYQIRCRQNLRSRQERGAHRRFWPGL